MSDNNLFSKPIYKKWWFWLILIISLFFLYAVGMKILDKKQYRFQKEQQKKEVNKDNIIPQSSGLDMDPDNPSKFIQADFVELDKVYMISKFRSGNGHDFSVNSGETCRSMKHYFSSMDANQPDYKQEGGGDKEKMPIPTIDKDVKIFSPVDGTLRFVDFDQIAFDHELQVIPDAYPDIAIRLMHVQNAPNVKESHVKAGQLIGLVLANQSFDLAIEFQRKTANEEKLIGYVSYFAAMPDEIFAKYQARGVKTRDDLITSKAYRDAHPFSCHGKEVFDKPYAQLDPANNFIYLSGFKELELKLNTKYNK